MTMHIHIHTQYTENYGTEAAPYWKCKGGQTIVVTGFDHPLTDGIGAAAARVVDALRARIEYTNPIAQEWILDWEFAEAGTLTRDEQLQMEYDGRIDHPAMRLALEQERG